METVELTIGDEMLKNFLVKVVQYGMLTGAVKIIPFSAIIKVTWSLSTSVAK